MLRKVLLICGIISSLFYVAINIFVPMQFPGYSAASQTVSELSAIGAPTRPLWIPLGIVYALLGAAFGWGVWKSALGNRPLQIAGGSIFINGVISIFWPPMHQREVLATVGGTLTDTMHIVFSIVTVFLFVLSIGFGAAALGKRFRLYSIATLVILLVFGILTGSDAPRLEANFPTPWIGVWERINIGVYLLWVVVLAIILLRRIKRPDVSLIALYIGFDLWLGIML
ncbi:MAG: DUF998 domain-containing protein [Bacteroidota bacterium]